jgi:hypothetical protein
MLVYYLLLILKTFKLEVLEISLLSQPALTSVRELFLVINYIKLVFSKFSDNKLALNHSFIFLNVILISSIKSVGLGLVTIILVSSAKKN